MGYQIKIPFCVYSGIGSIEDVPDNLKTEVTKGLVFYI